MTGWWAQESESPTVGPELPPLCPPCPRLCMVLFSCLVISNSFMTPWTAACQAPLSMGFSSKNTGVGCHFLLQEIFPTQGLNPGLPHCRPTKQQRHSPPPAPPCTALLSLSPPLPRKCGEELQPHEARGGSREELPLPAPGGRSNPTSTLRTTFPPGCSSFSWDVDALSSLNF